MKKVELVKVGKKPYLISREDEITYDDLCIFSIKGSLCEAYPDEILGPDILWVAKVIAPPDEIGYFRTRNRIPPLKHGVYDNIESTNIDLINSQDILAIKKNDGVCYLEMEEIGALNIYEPKILNGKVIINLFNNKTK